MVICHCLAVNDKAIAALATDGTIEVDDVVRLCGAGGKCGGCRDSIEDLLEQNRSQPVSLAGRRLVSVS